MIKGYAFFSFLTFFSLKYFFFWVKEFSLHKFKGQYVVYLKLISIFEQKMSKEKKSCSIEKGKA